MKFARSKFFLPLPIALLFVVSGLAQTITRSTPGPSPVIGLCNDRADSLKKPVRHEWVEIDKSIIKDRLNPLPPVASTVNGLKTLFPNFLDAKKSNCLSTTNDLGYGLMSTLHAFYGGYSTSNIDAPCFRNKVVKLRLTIQSSKEEIETHLQKIIKLPFDCLNGEVVYEKVYERNLSDYRSDSGFLFIESIDTNYRRKQALNYFTNIYTGGTFEKPFYILVGLGNETFDHLRYFIVNKDYEALRAVLFSPSPTSRLFAARTLLYMRERFGFHPDKTAVLRIDEALAKGHVITSGVLNCFVGKVDYDYFDVVKNFERYLETR